MKNKHIPQEMSDQLTLCVFGLRIRVLFYNCENIFMQNRLINIIRTYFKHYVQRSVSNKSFDYTISVVEPDTIPYIRQDNKGYLPYFEKMAKNEITTYYTDGYFQFAHLLQVVLLKRLTGAICVHCSSSLTRNGTFLFVGKSGAGKSTIVRLLKPIYSPLSDDSLILKKRSGLYTVEQNAFMEKGGRQNNYANKIFPVRGVFFIQKADYFQIKHVRDKSIILRNIASQTWSFDPITSSQLKFISDFVKDNTHFYNFYFKKTGEIIPFFQSWIRQAY